ncbi:MULTISPECIES: HNH endonuclease [unclassified Aureimonas]|uniref:HNH endonuclease n=1 Tax=unclassified Aureimonas TaxID=2615206 RepID=UPI000A5A02C7|nr:MULTISPECIES: HNH endonuclease signature motif containing protein [unclassified Aureimonas]
MSARASASERGYGTAWRKARAGHLRSHPHCVACSREGRIAPATIVDHIIPHRGDQRLFWDRTNWQSLCTPHHSGEKQGDEARGYAARVGADGLPTDPNHPFNRGDAR